MCLILSKMFHAEEKQFIDIGGFSFFVVFLHLL